MLDLNAYKTDGTLIDTYHKEKGPASTPTPTPTGTPSGTPTPNPTPTINPGDPTESGGGCGCELPRTPVRGAGTVGSVSLLVLCGLTLLRRRRP